MESPGLTITNSLTEALHIRLTPYKIWITSYAVNVDFRAESHIPGVELDGRCCTSIDRGKLKAGCTIFVFLDGERVKKISSSHRLPTLYLLLHHEDIPQYWDSRWEDDGWGEWDTWEKPNPAHSGEIERQVEDFRD